MKQEKINMLECNLNTEYAEENKYVNEMISSILKSKPELEDVCIEGVNLINNFSNKKLTYDLSKRFLDNFHNFIFRDICIKLSGFALITEKFIEDLVEYIGDKKCLEIMSGTGCLSKSLIDKGVDIICTDNYSWNNVFNMKDTWTDVEDIDCLKAIEKYGKDVSYIICSWIPYEDNIGFKALKLMHEINPNCKMIVIGEDWGGCTADDEFFNHCEVINKSINKNFRRWNGMHDFASVVEYTEKCIYSE